MPTKPPVYDRRRADLGWERLLYLCCRPPAAGFGAAGGNPLGLARP
jgi:hypothetical protein